MPVLALPFSSVIDVPSGRILARDDAGTGAAEALTNLQLFAILGTGTPSSSTYLRGDGAWATVSAGISSLNGLTDATQTFAVGTTGTNVAFSSVAGVHTLNIPDASATARGVVTTGSQTLAGDKTFSGKVQLSSSSYAIFQAGGALYFDVNSSGQYIFRGSSLATRMELHESAPRLRVGSVGLFNPGGSGCEAHGEGNRWHQRRGTNAQAWALSNTYTSDTSFERLDIAWASNVCTIEVTAGSAGGTLRGLKIGGASTSLLGFYGATPVDRPDTIADPTGGVIVDTEARTAINTLIDRLQELGLIT